MRALPVVTLSLLLAACPAKTSPEAAADAADDSPQETPVSDAKDLLAPWTGPHGGVPPFDAVAPDQFEPALRTSMDELLAEVDAIANNEEPATFANTIEAMERVGESFDRVTTVYYVYTGTMSGDELREVEGKMAPEMAGLWDKITQNEALFARIDAVYSSPEYKQLDPEQQRLTWKAHKDFVKSGAKLDAASKERLAAINKELAGLYTTFRQNLLKDEETWITIDSVDDLAGMPQSWIDAAAGQAAERELEGKWVIVNTRSSAQPFLTFSTRRDLRESVWRAFVNRGDNGGDTDNNGIITKVLALRAERAKLLGFETHAHWRLQDQMAKNPDNTMELMLKVWEPAKARVAEEVADMQKLADAEGAGITIEPWDYRFYMEKVRKERYDLDENEIKPYMQLEKLREAMFWVSGELYGLQWEPVEGLPVVHPDVRVWEVKDASGKHVGLWYFDPYARPGKRSGAWMNAYRKQERMRGDIPTIVSNNSNFVKGKPGEPVLISWDDAETLFHEFGHALHGLLSDVHYPSLSGTSVSRDYVEFPSQLNEHWLGTPEVLQKFCTHVETGEPIPEELVAKISKAKTFNQGFGTTEYLASALVDMKLHLAGDQAIDPDAFEKQTLDELGMPKEIVMRHRTPQFAHVFASDGYSSAYYSYLWADTLTADAAEAFKEAGSMYDKATADKLRTEVLSKGNTRSPEVNFEAFRGRPVDVGALMRDRGFPAE